MHVNGELESIETLSSDQPKPVPVSFLHQEFAEDAVRPARVPPFAIDQPGPKWYGADFHAIDTPGADVEAVKLAGDAPYLVVGEEPQGRVNPDEDVQGSFSLPV